MPTCLAKFEGCGTFKTRDIKSGPDFVYGL